MASIRKGVRGKPGGRTGFTLIELMTAMVILSVGLFAVIHLQVVTVRGNAYAKERNEAMRIAMGAAEELRTKALAWVDEQGIIEDDPALVRTLTGLMVADTPEVGVQMEDNANAMFALTSYIGETIAAGDDALTSQTINPLGLGPLNPAATGLSSTGAIYRIHYVAHRVRQESVDLPSDQLIRVTVFVSWDNKDHGDQSFDWDLWRENYWDRHMVAVTFYLSKIRNW